VSKLIQALQDRILYVVLMLLTPSNPPQADGLFPLFGALWFT
jgi:hypothetical protein